MNARGLLQILAESESDLEEEESESEPESESESGSGRELDDKGTLGEPNRSHELARRVGRRVRFPPLPLPRFRVCG